MVRRHSEVKVSLYLVSFKTNEILMISAVHRASRAALMIAAMRQ